MSLCLAAVFLPLHGCTAIRHYSSVFWKNPRWSPMRHCFSNSTTSRSKKRTSAALRNLSSKIHACLTAFRRCASLVPIVRRCQAACIASVAACSSVSVWAFPLQHRLGLLCSLGDTTGLAVYMMAAVNAAPTPSILLSLGGFALRYLSTTVASSC